MTDRRDAGHGETQPRTERRPGHELQLARERAGIDRETVAQRLRLHPSQLDALEQDDYAQLPPPTFVRGYIRTYAREVGLDADDLIAAYDASGAAVAEPEIMPAAGDGSGATGRGALVGVLLILMVVGAGAGVWLYQQRLPSPVALDGGDGGSATEAEKPAGDNGAAAADGASGDAEAPETGSVVAEATAAGENTAADADAAATQGRDPGSGAGDGAGADEAPARDDQAPAAGSGDGARESGVASAPGEATNADPEGTGETAAGSDAGRDATAASTSEADTEVAAVDADETDAEADGAASSAAGTSAGAGDTTADALEQGPDRLLLEFSGRSWVRVLDDRDRQLVSGLHGGAESLEFRGWAPFDVLLGNSPDVRIRFNGESVDKSRFTRSDDTARFLVDASGARPR